MPVSNFAPVQLTYTVKLVNPKTAEGTYGQYDADGSEGLDSLYTNNSATLYPMDSNNTEGLPENFPKPTVSYTVAQETGTLTVQKIVADHVEDWSFDFTATIGDKTEKFTLTKNDPTKTFDSIPLDTQYTVKEDNSGKYQVTSTNETGTITENSSAVFVNMPVDTGVLTISKTVEGQKNPTEKFTFTVNLPEGEYPYIYSTAQGNDEVSGHISNNETVTLSSGQSVSIYGLPVGASYTVTETANDDYTVSAEAIHGTVDGAVVSGTIPDLDDGAAAAHYTNTYHGSWIPRWTPTPPPDPDPGDKPELNTEDHYAYIVGYEDGSVQPEGDITRAEVATIFFRLLTDEAGTRSGARPMTTRMCPQMPGTTTPSPPSPTPASSTATRTAPLSPTATSREQSLPPSPCASSRPPMMERTSSPTLPATGPRITSTRPPMPASWMGIPMAPSGPSSILPGPRP